MSDVLARELSTSVAADGAGEGGSAASSTRALVHSLVYVPRDAAAGRMRAPLVVCCHGLGESGLRVAGVGQRLAAAGAVAGTVRPVPRPHPAGGPPVKILLAEDSALLRAGLAQVLRAVGHEVVEVGDADELVERAESTAPDLVVTDVRMPPGMGDDGLRAAQALRERWLREGRGPLPVLVLSQYVAAGYLDRLLEHGGFGYLLKERVGDVDELIRTLEEVAGGGTVVDPEVVATLLGARRRGVERLTPREREVLGLMAEGLSNAQIARRLVLSAAAVSKHVSGVFTKLGFLPEDENRRVRAVLIWLRRRGI